MASPTPEPPKGPYHKDNIEKTLQKRTEDLTNIVAGTRAAHGHLASEVDKLVSGDYTKIDEMHSNYDKNLADKVRAQVDKSLDVFGEHSRIKHHFKDDGKDVDKNYFFKKSLESIYFPNKEELKQTVGKTEDFSSVINQYAHETAREMEKEFQRHAVADINVDQHGKDLGNYFISKSGADASKLDLKILERSASQLAKQYVATKGNITDKMLYRMASKK